MTPAQIAALKVNDKIKLANNAVVTFEGFVDQNNVHLKIASGRVYLQPISILKDAVLAN
jgi:hypothetical protein